MECTLYVLNVVKRKPVKIQVILHFLRFTTCSPNRLDRSQSGPFTRLFSSANKCQTQRNGRWCFNPTTFVSTPLSFHTASFAICTSSLATKMYFIARKPSIQYEIAFAWAFLWLFIAEAVMIGVISKCAWFFFFFLSFCSQWVRVCVYSCNSLLLWNAICFCVHRNCLCTEHQHFDPWHNRSCDGKKTLRILFTFIFIIGKCVCWSIRTTHIS